MLPQLLRRRSRRSCDGAASTPKKRSRRSTTSASTPKSSTPPTAKPAKRVLVTGGGDASFGAASIRRFLPNPKPVTKTPLSGNPLTVLTKTPRMRIHTSGAFPFSQSEIALFLNCCLLIHIRQALILRRLQTQHKSSDCCGPLVRRVGRIANRAAFRWMHWSIRLHRLPRQFHDL